MATISKLPSGKFKAIVRNHNRARCKTFTRKTDAKAWAKRIEADSEAVAAMGLAGASMTFDKLVDKYEVQWGGRDQSINSRLKYWRALLGGRKLLDIDQQSIRNALSDYAAGMAMRGNGVDQYGRPKLKATRRPRAPATVNRLRSTLSAIFNFAIAEDLVNTNPVRGIKRHTEDNKRIRYLSDVERPALLKACDDSGWPKLRLLVLMALTTGARQGELLGLRWSDIDFKKRQAFLATTKNGEPRILPIPSPALSELEKWREVGNGLVFPSELRPARPFEFRKHWQRALETAGITRFRFHDLRHSAASYLVMGGASLAETAEVLGHKSIQTTMRYAHLSTKHKADLAERILGGMMSDNG